MEVVSGDNWTTRAISHAELQSIICGLDYHQQTNIQFLTGRMPFLSPNQQCQSTEGKISHSKDLLSPSSPGGLPTLSLTTNSFWLPWEGCHASQQPSDASTHPENCSAASEKVLPYYNWCMFQPCKWGVCNYLLPFWPASLTHIVWEYTLTICYITGLLNAMLLLQICCHFL